MEHIGNCHICGAYGKLSFEHIPPEGALNHGKAMVYTGDEVLKRYRGEKSKYQSQQVKLLYLHAELLTMPQLKS